MSDSRGMVDIPQALAQLSVDGINRGFAPPHTAGQVLDALRNLTNHIGLLLQEKYPELAGMLPQDISKLPLEKKMEIVRTINSVFYTALKPLPETAPGDTRTFGETLLFEHGGYCEDLTAVYIGCIELLRQGGIDLPLYPVMGPGHELVGWDDRGAAAVAAKPQQPAFYVELNTPREEGDDRPYGEVFVSPKDYEARLQWDPARSRGYFVSLPRSAVIAGELYNRVAAFNQREEPDLVEGLAEISCALRITKSAQLYNILAAVQEGRGDYNGA
ncbi:MAG TPA: hypothetical protein PLP17_10045, partial [Oligoflexia bacterium]|nr:hypothetical protein [Oligoflexia bacterium]